MSGGRPNILLLMTDQQRGDCLGIEGHPVVQTPNLDEIAAAGTRFQRAYTACPVCIPARRTLMTGQKPASHGVFMNYNTRLDGPTLPGELARAGYQTHLVGKLHLWPHRKLYGFMSADWSDAPQSGGDYERFLVREGIQMPHAGVGHGCDQNGWVARPWHLEERYHFTDGRRKYIWYPGTGAEHYFNLENDPQEMVNLADDPNYADDIAACRERLVNELTDRPEGFTNGTSLTSVGNVTPPCLPDYKI